MRVNEERLHDLVEQVLTDVAGGFAAAMVTMGDELGLYKALQDAESAPLIACTTWVIR